MATPLPYGFELIQWHIRHVDEKTKILLESGKEDKEEQYTQTRNVKACHSIK